MSLLKRAIMKNLLKTADAGLESYARSRRKAAAESSSSNAGAEEDPGDCLPCKAIERRKQAENTVKEILG